MRKVQDPKQVRNATASSKSQPSFVLLWLRFRVVEVRDGKVG